MIKQELIDRVALTSNSTKKAAEHMINHVLDGIQHGVMRDGETQITDFGKFVRVPVNERVRRNPATGAPVVVPASMVVRFRPGKGFADLVNGERDGE